VDSEIAIDIKELVEEIEKIYYQFSGPGKIVREQRESELWGLLEMALEGRLDEWKEN